MTKQPPKPCKNCGREVKPLRKGRCNRCSAYLAKHGVERPPFTNRLITRSCRICGRLAKPILNGRCHTCDIYWRRTGVERPYIADGRSEKVEQVPCSRCGRPWASRKGLCSNCYTVKQRNEKKGIPVRPFAYAQAKRKATREVVAEDPIARLQAEVDALRLELFQLRDEMRGKLQRLDATVAHLSRFRGGRAQAKAATPAPDEQAELLDRIAQGMAKKPYSKLSPTHQDVIRSLAKRLNAEDPS